ncbi:MAG TPA: transcriptional regulator [Candidatus Dormibacteraeota bacterium]|nr:transcriptional regulator [Candidatus Dormibacteraeota bacterium]
MNESADDNKGPALRFAKNIQSLNEQLGDSTFKSSIRVVIMILLAMNKKLSSVELRELLQLGKGSLENHLERLEAAGYLRVRNVGAFGGNGSRQMVEITEKGFQDCKALLEKIHNLNV